MVQSAIGIVATVRDPGVAFRTWIAYHLDQVRSLVRRLELSEACLSYAALLVARDEEGSGMLRQVLLQEADTARGNVVYRAHQLNVVVRVTELPFRRITHLVNAPTHVGFDSQAHERG